ncbi:MAG: thiamine phosphate synthase [Candidatus Omnitrophota bacterium]|nr:thiamine phosphate synthase [Candidatus Omnitrophota bacterium]
MLKVKDYSLYLVISEEYALGKDAVEIAELAIAGGVDIIQLREKNKHRDKLIKLAVELSRICKANSVTFIVNDDPLLAKEADADGVHLGQEDVKKYSISATREIIGKNKVIGVSTHSLVELEKANSEDVDYIAYGPIYPTKTKDYFLGAGDIKAALSVAKKPLVFIGGINLTNLDEILAEGARNIAVIRGIIQAADISAMARNFKHRIMQAKKETKMIIKINGKDQVIEGSLNLLELVISKKLAPESVVLEHNLSIVPKEEWENVSLRENDSLEIVSFMGGG